MEIRERLKGSIFNILVNGRQDQRPSTIKYCSTNSFFNVIVWFEIILQPVEAHRSPEKNTQSIQERCCKNEQKILNVVMQV